MRTGSGKMMSVCSIFFTDDVDQMDIIPVIKNLPLKVLVQRDGSGVI
jgi:hypothetical protein